MNRLPAGLKTNCGVRLPGVPGDLTKQPMPQRSGRSRHTPGVMNKREARYAETLEARRLAGEIQAWAFESLKFRLADRTWYTPDFAVWHNDGHLECVEVKGHMEDDAAVKWKVVRELFSCITWTLETGKPADEPF